MPSTLPGPSSPLANLTGNSQFLIDSSGTIWVISNTSTGAAIYKSTDNGVTFTQIVTIPGITETTVAFDPAACMSGTVIHFIGQTNVTGGIAVTKYSFDTSTSTLTGPFTVVTGSVIGSDYDIVPLSNGNCFLVCSLITYVEENVYGIEIEANGTIAHQDAIYAAPLLSGNRLGSVSLITPDGVNVEIYLQQHLKKVTFQDFAVAIYTVTRTAPASYLGGVTVAQFQARHIDNRLTVIAKGEERFLTQCYFTQSGTYLAGNLLLGHLPPGGPWSIVQVTGTPTQSFIEPTFSVSSAELYLAYIVMDYTKSPREDGSIVLYSVDPTTWTFTQDMDFYAGPKASFLRGTKDVFSPTLLWGFIGQSELTSPTYYTGFNSPPIVVLEPTTLSANRNVTYQISASNSYDPNGDSLSFVWSLSDASGFGILTPTGDTATFRVPSTIGPAAHTMTISVSVTDYDINGNPIHSPIVATILVTIAAVAAPTIGTLTFSTEARGASVTLSPAITNSSGTTLTYQWQQIQGTTLSTIGTVTGPTLTFNTAGANLAGETVVFELTVSDATNSPVSQTFDIPIAASTALGDQTLFLAQSVWPGTIQQRNTSLTWPVPHVSTIYANFTSTKRFFLLNGANITTFIGPNEVLVYGWDPAIASLLLRYFFLPNASNTIVDAVQTETDYTIILTSAGQLLQFLGKAPVLSTDDPDAIIDVNDLSGMNFTGIVATPTYANNRVLVLFGPDGCLILQVINSTFTVVDWFELTQESRLLYGSNNVTWVRLREVESVYTGQLLVGSVDGSGNTYETLVDIPTKTVLGTWTASQLTNKSVVTGEMLFQSEDTYAGMPTAPILSTPQQHGNSYLLNWTQERTDLITGYTIQYAANGGTFIILGTVGSGGVLAYATTLPGGNTYSFRVQALSLDGPSPWSNVVSI